MVFTMAWRWACLPILSVTMGCFGSGQIESNSIDYNRAMADHWNSQVFLNAVRASKRQAMYFTAITSAVESMTYSMSLNPSYKRTNKRGTLSSGTSSSHEATQEASVPLTVTWTPSSNMQIAPLDSDKFMKGFLTPLDAGTLRLYWELGWPREMLLFLFVRTFALEIPNRTTFTTDYMRKLTEDERKALGLQLLSRDATLEELTGAIEAWLKRLGLEFGKSYNFEGMLEEWTQEESGVDKTLASLEREAENAISDEDLRLIVQRETDLLRSQYYLFWRYRWFVHRLAEAIVATERHQPKSGVPQLEIVWGSNRQVGPVIDAKDVNAPIMQLAQKEGYSLVPAESEPKDEPEKVKRFKLITREKTISIGLRVGPQSNAIFFLGHLKMRSPEAILYHIGEMIRFCNEHPGLVPVRLPAGSSKPLFSGRRILAADDGWEQSIEHEGNQYVIPKNAGRSVAVMKLASQLILLYKSSEGLPSAGVVTLIGN